MAIETCYECSKAAGPQFAVVHEGNCPPPTEQVDRAHRNGGLYCIYQLFHGAYFTMRRYFNCMQVCLAYINTVFIHSDAAKQLYPPSDG